MLHYSDLLSTRIMSSHDMSWPLAHTWAEARHRRCVRGGALLKSEAPKTIAATECHWVKGCQGMSRDVRWLTSSVTYLETHRPLNVRSCQAKEPWTEAALDHPCKPIGMAPALAPAALLCCKRPETYYGNFMCESKRMQVCCAGLGLQKGCKMLPIRNFKCLAEFLLRVGIGKES